MISFREFSLTPMHFQPLLSLVLLIFPAITAAQAPPFFLRMDGALGEAAADIDLDSQGNLIVSVHYCSDPAILWDIAGQPVAEVPAPFYRCALMIAKYSAEGLYVWSVYLTGPSPIIGGAVFTAQLSIDPFDNIVVAGQFFSDPLRIYDANDLEAATISPLADGNVAAGYLAKFTQSGTLVFATLLDGTFEDAAAGCIADSLGNIIVLAGFQSSAVNIYDAQMQVARTLTQNYATFNNIYMVKYSPLGSYIWAYQWEGSEWEFPSSQGLAIDSHDNIYMSGYFTSISMVMYHANGSSTFSRQGAWTSILGKFNPDGGLIWATRIGSSTSSGECRVHTVTVDRDDNVIVGGVQQFTAMRIYNASRQATAAITVPYTTAFGFVVKFLGSNGDFMWVRKIDGADYEEVRSVTADLSGNIIIAGSYKSSTLSFLNATYGREANIQLNGANGGNTGGFVAKYSAIGSLLFVVRVDTSGADNVVSVDTDQSGSIFFCGAYETSNFEIYDSRARRFTIAKSGQSSAGYVVKVGQDGYWNSSVTLATSFTSSTSLTSATNAASTLSQTSSMSSVIWASSEEFEISSEPQRMPSISSAADISVMTLIVALVGIGFGLLICAGLFMYMFRRKQQDTTSKNLVSVRTTSTLSSFMDESTHTISQDTTMHVTSHELSIPAFTELKWGVDFVEGAFIAKGGGGELHLCIAKNPLLTASSKGNQLIVKRLGYNLAGMSGKGRSAFWQEISLMWKFRDHPHFAKFYGFSTEPVSIVMKFYPLGDMAHWIRGRSQIGYSYSKQRIIRIYRQYVAAIGNMHSQGLTHNDIKPDNVLLEFDQESRDLIPVVTDFGISRIVTDQTLVVKAFEKADLNGLSLAYAAPEVIFRFRRGMTERDAQIVYAGDVYSLSITLLAMLKRTVPWYQNGTKR